MSRSTDAADIGFVASHAVSIFERADLRKTATHNQVNRVRTLKTSWRRETTGKGGWVVVDGVQ
jgi:hypothetical protein